jgi:hypothetical protein
MVLRPEDHYSLLFGIIRRGKARGEEDLWLHTESGAEFQE